MRGDQQLLWITQLSNPLLPSVTQLQLSEREDFHAIGVLGRRKNLLPVDVIDGGPKFLASGCPNLRKLHVIGASEVGLLSVAEECPTLQELELQKCDDNVLRGIAACQNLQILKLIANVDSFYSSVVSHIGMTILAQGCKRLVKLELSDHRMDDSWQAALSFCENLKTLRIQSCKWIDVHPGPEEHLGSCFELERLHLQKCQLRDKNGVGAIFGVCRAAREIIIQDWWGLDDLTFSFASICRRVKLLSLDGCSLLSANNRRELRWRPDTKSLLPSSLMEVSMGKRGGKFFRRT
ncbi:hypothetical protein K1719_037418 [Acacia pycnantha]|nr:hypothetical protein K1719_037418 [Acacia pycnantha]